MFARFAVLMLLVLTGRADAHGLHAAHRVLSGNRIQIEGWYDTNEPASGADVQVLRADGSVLAEGRLDANGLWVFPFPAAEDLHVVIRDGTAHQAKLSIAARELTAPLPWRELLTGIGFLLAVAAFAIGWKNSRELRTLRSERRGVDHTPRNG